MYREVLKAYLIAKINEYPRTHMLVDLLNQCAALDSTFLQFLAECTTVDQYYIPTRYPDGIPGGGPFGIPRHTEAEESITAAKTILHFVTSQTA